MFESLLPVYHPAATKRLFGRVEVPAGRSRVEFAGWYAVATALLILDQTTTKV
jgi:hypothetical protein